MDLLFALFLLICLFIVVIAVVETLNRDDR